MAEYLRGMFSAYSLRTAESKVGVGIIEQRPKRFFIVCDPGLIEQRVDVIH
jgi:hypothetical protein